MLTCKHYCFHASQSKNCFITVWKKLPQIYTFFCYVSFMYCKYCGLNFNSFILFLWIVTFEGYLVRVGGSLNTIHVFSYMHYMSITANWLPCVCRELLWADFSLVSDGLLLNIWTFDFRDSFYVSLLWHHTLVSTQSEINLHYKKVIQLRMHSYLDIWIQVLIKWPHSE